MAAGSNAEELARELTTRALNRVALLLVANAGGRDASFPNTHDGVAHLVETIRPSVGDGVDIAAVSSGVEPEPDVLGGQGVGVLVRPTPHGALNLCAIYREHGLFADLHPDGRLDDQESAVFIQGPGPDAASNLSAETQRDVLAMHQRHEALGDGLPRFQTKELLRVLPAPWQAPDSVVFTSVELYTEGIILNFFVPNPSHEEPELELPMEMYRGAGMDPPVEESFYERERNKGLNPLPDVGVTDDLGTTYFRGGGGGHGDEFAWRGVEEYTPAPPDEARFLIVTTYAGSVEFGLTDA